VMPSQVALAGAETYREKAIRKFKQNPWVPIGCAATVGALTVAMFKLRRGQSQSFNYWLRARVAAQGLTIVALVAGTYSLRPKQGDNDAVLSAAAADAERNRLEKAAREREEFEERLRDAEVAHALETKLMKKTSPSSSSFGDEPTGPGALKPPSSSWTKWLRWGKGSSSETDKKL